MTIEVEVAVVQLPHALGLPLPRYETDGAAGADLRAALPEGAPVTLQPGERALIPTGLTIAVPDGCEAQVRPRSGLAMRQGLTCLNTPGTIDSDYRGEVGVLLINLGQESAIIARGERIAQLVIAPVVRAAWRAVDGLGETGRGAGGFGSTGQS